MKQVLEYKARAAHVKILDIEGTSTQVKGNPIKFNQVITNLVSNAIDSYESVGRTDKKIEIKLKKIKNMIKLEIQDWGSGIMKRDMPHIFEPLYTTKPVNKGMGLGLSICDDIIRYDLQGKCTVQTEVGKGTTFTIDFPHQFSQRNSENN